MLRAYGCGVYCLGKTHRLSSGVLSVLAVASCGGDPERGGSTLERPPGPTSSSSAEPIIPIAEPTSPAPPLTAPTVTGTPVLDPASTSAKTLSAYADNECWLTDGVLDCYESIAFAVYADEVPPGLTSISLGEEHLCGLDAAGNILCYGEGTEAHEPGTSCSFNNCGQSIVPPGTYKDVAASAEYTCGLLIDGSVSCWGEPPALITGTFTDIDVYSSRLCGLTTDSRIVCNDSSASTLTGHYSQLALGSSVCGITSGAVHCSDLGNQEGEFARISVGQDFACGLLVDGAAFCWGDGLRVPAPAGAFSAIASGEDYACAIGGEGKVCWGEGRGDGGAVLQCGFNRAKLSGTLAGTALDADWSLGSAMVSYDTGAFNWELELRSSDNTSGLLLLAGDDATVMNSGIPRFALNDGQSVSVTSGILLPPSAPAPSVYCVGGGIVRRAGDEALVDLTAIGALGTCPGEPVTGELHVCMGFEGDCGEFLEGSVTGTLDGQAFDDTLNGFLGIGGYYEAPMASGFLLWTEDRNVSSDASTGPLQSGLIFTDPAGPYGGAIYCAGEASTWEELPSDSFSNNTLITLSGLSRLGSCQAASPGTDQLTGCLR